MVKRFVKKIQTSGHSLNSTSIIVLIFFCLVVFSFDNVYGHGVGSETFPPVDLNGKLVTLEVSSSTDGNADSLDSVNDQQISFSLIDFDSKITLRDVTFLIKSHLGEQFLFEKEFKADNGFLVFNFISEETDSVVVESRENNDNFFGSLLGFESRLIDVKGTNLSKGGLYKFDVSVLTADGYSQILSTPLMFDVGISIPQTTQYDFVDPNFGEQNIRVITYYDEISNFQYDSSLREISFSMPFEWTESNINQTSVVHEEIVIPKEFGDLLVSGFNIYINGVQLSDDVINIDDFTADDRTVHFIIYKKELFNVFENNTSPNRMNFLIKPDRDYIHLSSVTDNGQFRILTTWEPQDIRSDSNVKIFFDITDVFLKNKPVAVSYDFSMTHNNQVIYQQSGTSSDSKGEHIIAEFIIPSDVSGVVYLNFENLDDNNHANTAIPVIVNRVEDKVTIPSWIKNSALWWSEEQIDDETFISSIEYLIQNKIITVSAISEDTKSQTVIPTWVRNNAAWWASGQIDDNTFIEGLKFLIQRGVINIPPHN